jgi:hypothetical protein
MSVGHHRNLRLWRGAFSHSASTLKSGDTCLTEFLATLD